MLLYKQHPRWPLGEATQIGGDIMDLPEDVTDDEWWEQTLRRWEATLELGRQRLANADTAMVRAYTQHVLSAAPDMRDQFTDGCWVLMKQRQPGKSKLRATGPYCFDGFRGG